MPLRAQSSSVQHNTVWVSKTVFDVCILWFTPLNGVKYKYKSMKNDGGYVSVYNMLLSILFFIDINMRL